MMCKFILSSMLLALFSFPGSVWPLQAAQEPEAEEAGQAATDLMTEEGQLSRVDPQSQSIWIKTSDGNEKQFTYTNQTQVTGGDDTVAAC
ncbi:MAG: hypothetical protein HY648_13705 [Acidobacteria bacterium]|nr:hypothetical protein [Acidobacteriota bacterium]